MHRAWARYPAKNILEESRLCLAMTIGYGRGCRSGHVDLYPILFHNNVLMTEMPEQSSPRVPIGCMEPFVLNLDSGGYKSENNFFQISP